MNGDDDDEGLEENCKSQVKGKGNGSELVGDEVQRDKRLKGCQIEREEREPRKEQQQGSVFGAATVAQNKNK